MQMTINSAFAEYTNCDADVIVYIGGGNTGKSFYVLEQKTILKFLTQEDKRILVTRKVGTSIKLSIVQGIIDGLDRIGLREKKHYKYNKVEKEFVLLVNINGKRTAGNKIMCTGMDDNKKIKSYKGITDIVMEEAAEYTFDDVNEASLRLREKEGGTGKEFSGQLELMLNPVDDLHWINNYINSDDAKVIEIFGDKDCEGLEENDKAAIYGKPKKWEFQRGGDTYKVFRSTYVDNEFLAEKARNKIDNLRHYNYNMFRRYRLGLEEILAERIFQDDEYTIGEIDIKKLGAYKTCYGLDFGFMSHPTAMVEVIKTEDMLYIHKELIHGYRMTNDDIIDIIEEEGIESIIKADSAEPKTIRYLQEHDIPVRGAEKGRGSVKSGIRKMKTYKIVINPNCKNVLKEFKNYKRKVDKNGKVTDEIIKEHDHCIDAIRYAIDTEESNVHVW